MWYKCEYWNQYICDRFIVFYLYRKFEPEVYKKRLWLYVSIREITSITRQSQQRCVERDIVESGGKAEATVVSDQPLLQLPAGAEKDHYNALLIVNA